MTKNMKARKQNKTTNSDTHYSGQQMLKAWGAGGYSEGMLLYSAVSWWEWDGTW